MSWLGAANRSISQTAPPSGGFAADLFPRTYGLYQTQWQHYNDTTFKTNAARNNIVEFSTFITMEQTLGVSLSSIQAAIAATAASTYGMLARQSVYINNQELAQSQGSGDGSTFTKWVAQAISNNDYLRTSWPGGTIVGSGDTNSGTLNNTNQNTIIDGSGRTFFQRFAWYFWNVITQGTAVSLFGEANNIAANPNLNVFFIDNRFNIPRVTGAWGNTTTSYNPATNVALLSAWQQQGHALTLAALRALAPNILLIGNCDYYSNYIPGSGSNPILDPSNVGLFDGVFCENAQGIAGAKQGRGNDFDYFGGLVASEALMATNGTQIISISGRKGNAAWSSTNQNSWVAADWTSARYALAMICQRNWHLCLNSPNYSALETFWMDELQQLGGIGWGGSSTGADPPQAGPTQNGVYIRNFPHMVAAWNPSGNGNTTFNAPNRSGMRRCTNIGFGDPTINTGVAVASGASLPIADGDGLFLVAP